MTATRPDAVVPVAVEPQLMFVGDAAAAMELYTTVFGESTVELAIPSPEGSGIMFAVFSIAGHRFRCIDSAPVHDFTFTPSISFAVDCATAADVDTVVGALSAGGSVMMPLDSYPFNERYAWISDRFGVSWQVGVAARP